MRIASFASLCAALALSSCACDPPVQPAAKVCGNGAVDGTAHAVDPARTRFVIAVKRPETGGACAVFHSHVVLAEQAVAEYDVKSADAAGSTMKVTVAAAGLNPDDPDLRKEFLAEGENQPLSDGDRNSIRGSVLDEVQANDNPTLTFTISELSATSGAGTAQMTANIAGLESTVPVNYTVTKDGDAHVIVGDAVLDGAPHGIPRNALGFCVDPLMDVHFELALVPGVADNCAIEGVEPFTPTFFDDQECAENVSYNEVRDVVGVRCMGCHGNALQVGATVPLVAWEDWRTDSLRNPGRALYETAEELVHLDPTEGLAMPPQPPDAEIFATDLTPDEEAAFDAWVADGARNAKCENDPGVTDFGARINEAPCSDDDNYTTDNGNGSPKQFFDTYCAYCHLDTTGFYSVVPQYSVLDEGGAVVEDPEVPGQGLIDFELAAANVLHPYYLADDGQTLSFWQASPHRVEDDSMPPGGEAFVGDLTQDPAYQAFVDWINAGYAAPCAP